VALATKWIGEPAEEPEVGEVTVTVANTEVVSKHTRGKMYFIFVLQLNSARAHECLRLQQAFIHKRRGKLLGTLDVHQLTFKS
jgi:hypothetical protein